MRFFITGLPRSRTAWFAVATGAAHEPISRLGYDAFWPMWSAWRDMGVSDSGAAMHLEIILETLAPKTLIIERLVPQVMKSMQRYLADVDADWAAISGRIEDLARALKFDHPLIKRVPFDELDQRMGECMDWLGVQPTGLGQMMHMHVESSLGWNLEQLRKAA